MVGLLLLKQLKNLSDENIVQESNMTFPTDGKLAIKI